MVARRDARARAALQGPARRGAGHARAGVRIASDCGAGAGRSRGMNRANVVALHPAGAPPPARAAVWRGVCRLLAVRVDNLGDVLMTTPALAAAAQSVPGIEITLLGGDSA